MRIVLLPGMDGTGDLFAGFVAALPSTQAAEIVRYPADIFLSYAELMHVVRAAVPGSDAFVLLAESFSTPLAIQFAATHPPNLKGLILCAGFTSSPLNGLRRVIASLAAPLLFRARLPKLVDSLLIGPAASASLQAALRSAIASVAPTVLAARLRAILSCDARAALSRIEVPILYLRATQDRLVPPRCVEEILQIKPQAEVASIEGPHLLLQREPQATVKAVRQFLFRFR